MNLKIKKKGSYEEIKSVSEINKIIGSSGIEIVDNYSEHQQLAKNEQK